MKDLIRRVLRESIVNKFDFRLGKVYQYEQLPKQIKDDIDIQFDDVFDLSPFDYEYVCKIIPNSDLAEIVEEHFGREWPDYAETDEVKKLIKDIKKKGLDYPSVGYEGYHRALVYFILGLDLPYLEMVEKDFLDN